MQFVFLFSFFFLNFAMATKAASDSGSSSNLWSSLNVAVVQYPLVGGLSVDQLFDKVKGYVDTAAASGAQLIVLPELFALDMLTNFRDPVPEFPGIIRELYPKFVKQLRELATEKNIYLLAGSWPVELPETKKIRNRSYLFAANKEPVYQEKMFLTPDEIEVTFLLLYNFYYSYSAIITTSLLLIQWGWEATDTLNVIEAPWGTTAITICYDSEFPLVSQTVAGHVVDLLLIPSMTGDSGFTRVRWSAQARAIEHMSYVLLTGITGAPAPGWGMAAQAVVLGPSLPNFTPPTIAEGEKDVAGYIVYATLNMTALREAKSTGQYYPAADQRDAKIEQTISTI
jgi:predicted amidohydrolase